MVPIKERGVASTFISDPSHLYDECVLNQASVVALLLGSIEVK